MKRQRILLTGEKKENALPLSLFLEGQDFRVTVEENSSRFVKQVRGGENAASSFDLLVAGTQMPEKLLIELLLKLEISKVKVPLILISDNGRRPWFELLKSSYPGLRLYAVKPTEPQELVKVVKKIFEEQ